MRWCAFFKFLFISYFSVESALISIVSASVIRNRRQNHEIITSDFNDVVKAVAGHIQNGQNVVIVEYQESPQNQQFRPHPPPQFGPQFPPHGFQGFYPQPPHRGPPGYFGPPSEGYPHRYQPFSPQFPQSYQNHHPHSHNEQHNDRPNFNNNPDDSEKYIFSDHSDKSNLAEENSDKDKKNNVDGYIDNFPVILLNANEIK